MVKIPKSRNNLLDSVRVGFLLTDTHSKILYANRQAEILFGYRRGGMEGQRVRTLFLDEDLTYLLPNIIYLTLYQNGFTGEALLKQKGDTKVFVEISTSSLKEEGEVFLTFSFQEIQRLKTLEKQKVEMMHWATLGMMMEEIAHQIRNPIVSIGGFAQRLLKTLSLSRKGKSYFDQILGEARRLETMVRRMEEFILIPKPLFQKVRILEVVEKALLDFSRKRMENSISILLEEGAMEKETVLFVDRDLVTRVIFQVLENSMEAVRQAPAGKNRKAVRVVLSGDGERVGISISDKGDGIGKKNLAHIFDPFFTTRPGHVGLGMSSVKRIIDNHGGTVRVESRLKRGTTVSLLFPKDRRRKIRRELLFTGDTVKRGKPRE